jgi:putative transposase
MRLETSLCRGLSTVGHMETFALDASNAWGEDTSTRVGAILPQQVTSLNQESPSFSKQAELRLSCLAVESVKT